MRALVLALALPLVGCVAPIEDVLAPEPGDVLTLTLASEWRAEDRAAIEAALSDWRVASDGLIDVRIGRDGDATLYQGPVPGGAYSTWSRRERWARIDMALVESDGRDREEALRELTAHLVGRMLGMALHEGRGVLAEDPERTTSTLTEDDVHSCRRAGLCPNGDTVRELQAPLCRAASCGRRSA